MAPLPFTLWFSRSYGSGCPRLAPFSGSRSGRSRVKTMCIHGKAGVARKDADMVVSKKQSQCCETVTTTPRKHRSHEFGAKGDPVFYRKARVTLWYCPGILSGVFVIIMQKSARRRKTRCLTSKHVDNEIRRKFAKSPFDELTEKTPDFRGLTRTHPAGGTISNGSSRASRHRKLQCRCGPEARPVIPTSPSGCP